MTHRRKNRRNVRRCHFRQQPVVVTPHLSSDDRDPAADNVRMPVRLRGQVVYRDPDALEGLSKVIALEGADKGVTSNTVCPGYVRTPLVEGQLTDQARAHGIAEDEVLDSVLLARTPLKRLVEPEEVADAVAFLCSPAATSMTGTSLSLDGGWTAA